MRLLQKESIDVLSEYQKFQDVEEFIIHIEIWLVDYREKFTRGELIGFKQLIRFSSKVPGVCYESINTLTSIINEEYIGQNISRSTFKRMTRKCCNFGLLNVYETVEENGAQGNNLYVFNRYPGF
jgi:hypothetical protein